MARQDGLRLKMEFLAPFQKDETTVQQAIDTIHKFAAGGDPAALLMIWRFGTHRAGSRGGNPKNWDRENSS